MIKKRSSQPILSDDERESSTRDLGSQLQQGTHKMPGRKTTTEDAEKAEKDKGPKKK